MTPLLCFVFAVSLAIIPTSESARLIREEPGEPSVSEILESVNKNSALLGHGDIRRTLRRNAAACTETGCKWPKSEDGLVRVPYRISRYYSDKQSEAIREALESFHSTTCIRFIELDGRTEQDYLYFFSRNGCWSYVGRQGGRQYVSLQANGCVYRGVIQHELLHALGFHHEQVRSDRNSFVQILFDNIQQGMEHNFRIENTNNLETPYDFNSVMQYSNKAFSRNGKDTIIARSDPSLRFGRARQMNGNDIARVNKLYKCGCVRAQKAV